MKIVIAGGTGLVGKPLVDRLRTDGHRVIVLSRGNGKDNVAWAPERGILSPDLLDGADAVINLAGANIAEQRWTAKRKQQILQSRIDSTRTLVEAMKNTRRGPCMFLNASAIGFYGDRGDEMLTESSDRGSGFLADVCDKWEAEADRAGEFTTVIKMRFGIILSPEGGALAKMLPLFNLGAGGPLGDGRQYMSWIDINDVVGAICFLLKHKTIEPGSYNFVAPNAVRNADFTKQLASAVHRPAFMPAPALALKAAMGEMAQELLLASSKVLPTRLERCGYNFAYPDLQGALRQAVSNG